ncbi:polysaccharide pyruvyl transferase family protein [Glaciecola sp. 2405UD65-10]|uniref:polysaccharide pyruvyl transferase family protein n=1 Tax=Glaciecola sp. 2405UD65-10 TaxID=3397244 RepID=UPI003B598F68
MIKKNIATLTLPLTNNYGGILQAFALQETLLQLGHETMLINIKSPTHSNLKKRLEHMKQRVRNIIKNTPVFEPDFTSESDKTYINRHVQQFIDKYIATTKEVSPYFKFDDLNQYKFESFVVGSDQVWRPDYSFYLANYFFEFLENVPAVKKLSYAASFGVENWKLTEDETSKCKQLIKSFDAVSVREVAAASLCEKHLATNATMVLDPTLLVPKETYCELVEKASLDKPKGNLFCYILDRSEENEAFEKDVAKSLNAQAFGVMPRKDLKNLAQHNVEEFVFPPIEEWLNGFIHADFVITDSFHGTVFAILFNKPFLSIGNTKRGLSRFSSLLDNFKLNERLILEPKKFEVQKLTDEINWEYVNNRLVQERERSLAFLSDNV